LEGKNAREVMTGLIQNREWDLLQETKKKGIVKEVRIFRSSRLPRPAKQREKGDRRETSKPSELEGSSSTSMEKTGQLTSDEEKNKKI